MPSSATARHATALRAVAAVGLAVLIVVVGATGAHAATFAVTTTADPASPTCPSASNCSLRGAIAASSNGDTVSVPVGHYTLDPTQGQIPIFNGVTVQGAGASSTIVDGGGVASTTNRVFHVFSGVPGTVTLSGLDITGGNIADTGGGTGGGGIRDDGSGLLVLIASSVDHNTVSSADTGGQMGGGGIWSAASVQLRSSAIASNTVTATNSNGDSGGGGLLQTGGNLTALRSTISHNSATVSVKPTATTANNGGGGVYQDGSDISLSASTIDHNTVTVTGLGAGSPAAGANGGGGIYQFGNQTTITASTISDNTAHVPASDRSGGGGIFDDGDVSYYSNATFAANTADTPLGTPPATSGGGGIFFDNPHQIGIANVTVARNSAPAEAGGGMFAYTNSNGAGTVVTSADSIVASNTSGTAGTANCGLNPGSAFDSAGHNLADDAANSCAFTNQGDVISSTPGLGALQDNGGATQTIAPSPTSPAVNGGDPAGCSDAQGNPLAVDQRGVIRPQPLGGRCDIGAYEQAPPAAVTGAASAVGATGATLNGTAANPDVQAGLAMFQFGPTTSYGSQTPSQPIAAQSSGTAISAALSGLAPGTYHFRLITVNPDGFGIGSDGVFVAAAQPPPAVTTGSASKVTTSTAILNATVNPLGSATTVHFVFGLSTAYGASTPDVAIGSGAGSAPVTAALSKLSPAKRYHFRAVATSAAGTTVGADSSFVTQPVLLAPRAVRAHVSPGHDHAAPYRFTISGNVLRPVGMTAAAGCRGIVSVQVKHGSQIISSLRPAVRRDCTFRASVSYSSRRLRRSGQLRFAVRFLGNAALLGRSAPTVSARYG